MITHGLREWLRGSTGAALAFAARTALNIRFSGIGEMTELSVDTTNKSLRLRVDLVGESETIEIDVAKYSLHREGDNMMVTIHDATASRKWLTEALRQFVVGQSFKVPPAAGALLNLLA